MSVKKKVILRLTQSKEDGHWLHFEDSKGRKAGINIENKFPEPELIGSCIRRWATDQFDIDTCFSCPYQMLGDCNNEEVEEASGNIGFMNVEYNILHKNKPHNCPLDNKKIEQLKLDKSQLEKLGFKKKIYAATTEKITYEFPYINGCFYYNENETIYRWYQKTTLGNVSNHINLNIQTLPALINLLECFRINK